MRNLVLVGRPNVGKTSLFNKLTGLNQKVGNYSGVTVEVKTGKFKTFTVTDIPGLRSLDTHSPEERISKQQLLNLSPEKDLILYVANGMQLAESLVFFSQIADLQIPSILLINFKDEMEANHLSIDTKKLQNKLGCPILLMNSKTGEGIDQLEQLLKKQPVIPHAVNLSAHNTNNNNNTIVNEFRQRLTNDNSHETLTADYSARLNFVQSVIRENVRGLEGTKYLSKTQQWDNILLHPILGIFIFLFVLFLLFQAVFSISSYPMDWIDGGMAYLAELASNNISIEWLRALVADALLPGIGGVIIFIPQIAILFFLLGILEHTGYLSRISFISDAFLRKFGLSGHSVVPLMSSWACAIPAIMSARIIANPKERLAVILASPLMTCSARLPVYAILIAVLFPDAAWGVKGFALLLLYLLGVVATLVVSWVITRNNQDTENTYWILELPVFRMPNWNNILINVYQKTKSFVVQAGKIILGISIILWLLSSYSPHEKSFLDQQYQTAVAQQSAGSPVNQKSIDLEYSYLGYIGKFIEPTIQPLGYDWKIGIGLLTSFAAREVFVGTLSTIYSVESEEESTIVERLRNEKIQGTNQPRFGWATSVSLLLFYVFALQCMSTVAITRKETGTWKYPIIQFVFMLVLAYVFAFVSYQLLA